MQVNQIFIYMNVVELYVKDRMVLMYILSIRTGNKMTLQDYMLKKEIMSKVSLTEEDFVKYEIVDEGGGNMKWNLEKDRNNPMTFEIDDKTSSFFKKMVDTLSSEEYVEDVWDVIQKVYDNC